MGVTILYIGLVTYSWKLLITSWISKDQQVLLIDVFFPPNVGLIRQFGNPSADPETLPLAG